MKIQKIHLKNFKSFQDVEIDLDQNLNVFTGINNSGKTNLIEAISLWHECFNEFFNDRRKNLNIQYDDNEFLNAQEDNDGYCVYKQNLKSIRSSNLNDIFYQCNNENIIEITCFLTGVSQFKERKIEIGFSLEISGSNYKIKQSDILDTFSTFKQFVLFLTNVGNINAYYASPVATIRESEKFATTPQIVESIQKRESVEVIRNRLYALYNNQRDLTLYDNFVADLSYILFNREQNIEFFIKSDIRQDVNVKINYKIESKDIEKDISLLGSGTLQIIVILLNLYSIEQQTDLNLILFDEPDSHIHRDIQKRLIEILTKFSEGNQIFITTHNESLIRQTPLHQLFHLEDKPNNYYQPLSKQGNQNLAPHFKGIYPSATNPIISSLGDTDGLDFINAIEADKIIFVEGQDDAKAIYLLLQKAVTPRNTKKYVFWILGGINNIFRDIPAYKTIFSQIKNDKNLWEKSVLIFDRDFLNDKYWQKIPEKMEEKLKLKTYVSQAYTFEAILLTNLDYLSKLLGKWIKKKDSTLDVNQQEIYQLLELAYTNLGKDIKADYLDNDKYIKETAYRYRSLRDRIKEKDLLGENVINVTEFDLKDLVRNYLQDILDKEEYFKFSSKKYVEKVIQESLKAYDMYFDIEQDFLDLLNHVDKSIWFAEWDFLTKV